MKSATIHSVRSVAIIILSSASLRASDTTQTNSPPHEVLLKDAFGRLFPVPTNQVPKNLLPPPEFGIQSQIPEPQRGTKVPPRVVERLEELRAAQKEFQFFPSAQPELVPYLAAQDEYGNTAIRPGPLIPETPIDAFVQQGKYRLSDVGLRYSLQQTFTFVSMSDVMQGENVLGFYTFDLAGKCAICSTADSSTAGWISYQIEAKTGLGSAGDKQDAARNLGSITDPT